MEASRQTPDDLLTPCTLAEGLRLAVARSCLTLEALADSTGISASALSHYVHGSRMPSADRLRLITKALAEGIGVDADSLWLSFGALLDSTATGGESGAT